VVVLPRYAELHGQRPPRPGAGEVLHALHGMQQRVVCARPALAAFIECRIERSESKGGGAQTYCGGNRDHFRNLGELPLTPGGGREAGNAAASQRVQCHEPDRG
jgi:hypothetical protein